MGSFPPSMNDSGLPRFSLDDPEFFNIVDAGTPNPLRGPPIFIPGGNFLQFVIPIDLASLSSFFQAAVLDPTTANGWFAVFDACENQFRSNTVLTHTWPFHLAHKMSWGAIGRTIDSAPM